MNETCHIEYVVSAGSVNTPIKCYARFPPSCFRGDLKTNELAAPLLFSPLKADVTRCHADNDLLIVWDSRSSQLEKCAKMRAVRMTPHVVGQGN